MDLSHRDGSAPDGTPLIELSGVAKRFPDGTAALDRVSLTIDSGEFVSLVGPSGCGKTTLLRLIAGLATRTSGSIVRATGDLGYVFQEPTLLPWRTVRGNVELVAGLRGVGRTERRRRADTALAQVGLTEFAGHLPHALSGGMRMRAALAQSLTARPRLLLLDEPYGAVDELTRNRLCDQLQTLYLQERFTAVLVTHSISEAVYLSNRVVVMSARPGRVVAEIDVPLPYPRQPGIRYRPEFAAVAAAVAAQLREGGQPVGAAGPQPDTAPEPTLETIR